MRAEHDLVGLEGGQRVLERQQRVRLAGVARGVDALLVHALGALLGHVLGALDRLVGMSEVQKRDLAVVERRGHHEHLGLLRRPRCRPPS